MTNTFHKTKRKLLEQRRDELVEEIEAAYGQLGRELNAATQKRIERQIAALEAELLKIESELEGLAARSEPKKVEPDKPAIPIQTSGDKKDFQVLSDALQIVPEHNGRPYKAGPAQWWVRLQVESNQLVPECRGQLYQLLQLENEEDTDGKPVPESQVSLLSWADNKFTPITIQPHTSQYLDLAWRAHGDPPIPAGELRVASSRDEGTRNTHSPDWGQRQDFIPLKPGHYLLVVRLIAKDFAPLECTYRLHWPGPGQEDAILLTEMNAAPVSPITILEQSGAAAVTLGGSPDKPLTDTLPSLPGTIETAGNFIKRWLWVQFLLWTAASAISFTSNLGGVLDLSLPIRLVVLLVLILGGGVVILAVSLMPAQRANYRPWDRVLTTILLVAMMLPLLFMWQTEANRAVIADTITTPTPSPTPTTTVVVAAEPVATPQPTVRSMPLGLVQHTTPTGRIVYTCFVDNVDQICVMDTDGQNQQQLTFTETTNFYPSFSADGQQILFTSRRDGNFDIYVMNSDGSDQRPLTRNMGDLYAAVLSPDGSRVAFTSAGNIWVMDVDGTNLHTLTNTPDTDLNPVWSPDGTKIAFFSNRDGQTGHYVMNADGSDVRRLPANLAEIGERSDWSPDGRWLVFHAGPQNSRQIYVIATDGSELYRLTERGSNLVPSFSPDGQWITYTAFRSGYMHIFIMRLDGSDVVQLTTDDRPNWQPRWGP